MICCLGNGPSSEAPAVRDEGFDALFRVNYQWRAREFLTNPKVIFTADPDLPLTDARPILAFPTRADANRILLKHCRYARAPRTGYLVFTEIASALTAGAWPARPTNGALMIATAAALAPDRIIIAGVDLYNHPAGRYPGTTEEANAYDGAHSRGVDIEVIRLSLSGFRGEVVVLGDELRRALG